MISIETLYQYYLQYPNVQTDTRKLQAGDIFFALKGPSFNGNEFARKALDAGAAYAVIDDPTYITDERCLLVNDVLTALQALAHYHRMQLKIPFIGITGSNGKTTTKELITAVLRTKYKTYATIGNLNNHIGVPLTILSIRNDAEMAIIEMGANHLHEIEGYCKVAVPTHGLINNCGKAHLEGFGSIENIRKGKGELYDFIIASEGTIFRNADLDYLNDMAHGYAHQITYGMANADYIGKPLTSGVLLQIALLNSGLETTIATQLVGDYNFPNVMAAIAIGLHFGVSLDNVKAAINAYTPDNSRSQWLVKGSNNIILDAYNANPSSMRAAILNFAQIDAPKKVLLLGAMKEMGESEANEHSQLVALIDQYEWESVVLVGEEYRMFYKQYQWFPDVVCAGKALANAQPIQNATVLVKGSRGSKMETLLTPEYATIFA